MTGILSINRKIDDHYLFFKKRLTRGTGWYFGLPNMAKIHASTATNWLKHYNLREVQYMAGHKYVSSTERYRTDNLEDLQQELEKNHPIK